MRKSWGIIVLLFLLLVVMMVCGSLAAPASAEEEPVCTIFFPMISRPCTGFWFSCSRENWPECECPWCLPGEEYCVRWNPEGDLVPSE